MLLWTTPRQPKATHQFSDCTIAAQLVFRNVQMRMLCAVRIETDRHKNDIAAIACRLTKKNHLIIIGFVEANIEMGLKCRIFLTQLI